MLVPVRGGVGPQVNKFEQVSRDDHQMSVAGGKGQCIGLISGEEEGEWGRSPGVMSGNGGGTLPIP